MDKRDNLSSKEYKQYLKAYHQASDRHVLVLETDLSYSNRCHIAHDSDLERKAGNELIAKMKKNYEQLIRTKRYRKLKKLYGKYSNLGKEKAYKNIAKQMREMQIQYHVTWEDCRRYMIPIGKKYGLYSVFALTKAEDVWKAMEKCLYAEGKTIHFSKRGELPTIQAKQRNRGIVLSAKEHTLQFQYRGISFGVKEKDRFEREEVEKILFYLSNAEEIDRKAVDIFQKERTCISTYRPCYATLVCKKIRGKLRVYIHITIEGVALPKYDRSGNRKHRLGKGVIGCDIGTQTIAYTSESEVGLKNLAERGSSILENERRERRLYRAMERSRRAMNPQNYEEDGRIKKGKKTWKYSRRYQKLKEKHTRLCRVNAINRHLAILEDVNYLRSLGNIFVTEPKNAKNLKKRTKNTAKNENGKNNRKKRFGKSIKNRCCGYFQAQIEKKFSATGGIYIEVSNDYRASQYDHTSDTYVKKKLSTRMYALSDGRVVQRDWYSSFLLYNIDEEGKAIDKKKCIDSFEMQYRRQREFIEWLKQQKIKVLNSGIKVDSK